MTKYIKLFESGYLGKLRVKNRVVQAPMATRFAARDGSVTDRLLHYYRERARGGAGLIIIEEAYIDKKASQTSDCQLAIHENSYIPGLSTLSQVIKDNGAKAGIQICHAGSMRFLKGGTNVSPSRISANPTSLTIPAELTIEEIKEIRESFGNSARIAEQSGFDMVEIHGGHGYFVHQFLSSLTNKRADIYGVSLNGRMRFALEAFDCVKRSVSKDFPIGMRISASDHVDGGITIEDSKVLSVELEKAGIDVIHVSAGSRMTISETVPMHRHSAFNVHLAEAIKKVVTIPVIASGSITTPQLAEQILRNGQGDFVSLARPLLADPWFARKAYEGRDEDIIPCIRCNDGCLLRGASISRTVSCTVNIAAGFEGEFDIQSVPEKKKVAVIGGGPAGMEAARVAALRGRNVSLYDEGDRLGGLLVEASVPEFKKDLRNLIDYQVKQLEKLGVNIILGVKATVQMIRGQNYDAVILATGSLPVIPDIPGIREKTVMTALDVLRGGRTEKDVAVIGGGMVGCEVALFLAEQGKRIRIIEKSDDVATGIGPQERLFLFEGFDRYRVQINTGLRLTQVIDGGVEAIDKLGKKHSFHSESIVLSFGFESRKGLFEELQRENVVVYPAGDCIKPRRIYDAIHEAFLVSYQL